MILDAGKKSNIKVLAGLVPSEGCGVTSVYTFLYASILGQCIP